MSLNMLPGNLSYLRPPVKGSVNLATLSEPEFFILLILNMNVYSTITNINHLPYANFSCKICWIKMTISIICSQ